MSNEKKARAYASKTIAEALKKISPKQQKRTEQKMLLAAKIADTLESKGWSQKEFAKRTDRHESEVTKWLSGTHNFTSDTLFDIQEVLGIRIIELEPNLTKGPVLEIKIAIVAPSPWPAFLHEHEHLLIGQKTSGKSISRKKLEAYA